MNMPEVLDVTEAKRRARAEIEGYREKRRQEREAKARAEQSADEEIAEAIRARRAEEDRVASIRAQLAELYAKREADIEANRKAEHEKRLAGEPRLRLAETPARRVAKLLRKRLGDDFDAFMTDLKMVDWRLFKIEVARIPQDERCEALHREREARAAERAAAALELPEPDGPEERAILARYGFAI